MKICVKCWAKCQDSDAFCPYCGNAFGAAAPKAEDAQNAAPQPPAQPEAPAQPQGFVPPQPPAQPEAPVQPQGFVPPQAPSQPEAPVQPQGFVPPQAPAQPEAPAQPQGFVPPQPPVQPEVTAQPQGFVPPQAPSQPEAPAQPQGFVPPQAPAQPETPAQPQGFVPPQAPAQPEAPAQPQGFVPPQAPVQPEAPAQPQGFVPPQPPAQPQNYAQQPGYAPQQGYAQPQQGYPPQQNYAPQGQYAPPAYQQPVPKKKGKAGLVIAIVLVLAVLGVGGFFGYKYFFSSPESVAKDYVDSALTGDVNSLYSLIPGEISFDDVAGIVEEVQDPDDISAFLEYYDVKTVKEALEKSFAGNVEDYKREYGDDYKVTFGEIKTEKIASDRWEDEIYYWNRAVDRILDALGSGSKYVKKAEAMKVKLDDVKDMCTVKITATVKGSLGEDTDTTTVTLVKIGMSWRLLETDALGAMS